MRSSIRAGLIAATFTGLCGAAAPADLRTYYHVGNWDAFSGQTADGKKVCGVGSTNPVDNRSHVNAFRHRRRGCIVPGEEAELEHSTGTPNSRRHADWTEHAVDRAGRGLRRDDLLGSWTGSRCRLSTNSSGPQAR